MSLKIPESFIFDLDGVITMTAKVHATAWKKMFDSFLQENADRNNIPFREFTHSGDYLPYVDGKPRYKGVDSFLKSRGINLPFGDHNDPPEKLTVCGLGNKKNNYFTKVIHEEGVTIYESTLKLMNLLRDKNIPMGVASSSKNCLLVLEVTNLLQYFKTRVDGVVSKELGLKGKPAGDIFVKAAENIGASAEESVVLEDAVSGVQAGRNGNFGLVIGIARENTTDELIENGADIAVNDLSEINFEDIIKAFNEKKERE